MSITREAIHDYYRRTDRPGAHHKDPWYHYQTSLLQDILGRLEVILEDEGVPEETIRRVIRCMLYGSPHASDAELRAEQLLLLAEALQNSVRPVLVPRAGLPADLQNWISRVGPPDGPGGHEPITPA